MTRVHASAALAALLLAATAPSAAALTGPREADAGDAERGSASRVTVTLSTARDAAAPGERVTAARVEGRDAAAFTIEADRCSGRAITSACTVTLAFRPTVAGPAEAALVVEGEDAAARVPLAGSGFVIGARLTPSQALVDFGAQAVGAVERRSFTVENTGDRTVEVRRGALEGPGANHFLLGAGACAGARLAPGARCDVQVAFVPPDASGGGAARYAVEAVPEAEASVELHGATAVPLPRLAAAVALPPRIRAEASARTFPPSSCGVVGLRHARASGRTIRVTARANCPAKFRLTVSRRGRHRTLTRRFPRFGTRVFRIRASFGTGEYRVGVATVVKGQYIHLRRAVRVR